ncbi:TNF receptor-associated factor 2-like [Ruditapes philippinarum]|uniref:TNF receptor-associated factor 2-like n=1 Tax=Ruditapes philippinarum TaxID=129788 RepID=UPI00295A8B4E|nr:TNF receptor-associated factor 2-like [Ruditapes philippinarum]
MSVVIRKAQQGVNVQILLPMTELESHLCEMCRRFPKDPVQTLTGHRFCKDCFTLYSWEGTACKACVLENITGDDDCLRNGVFNPDNGSKRDVDKMQARCLTCHLVTSMKNMETHHCII